jgi:transcriptional regulator with XRE-family HTH domain
MSSPTTTGAVTRRPGGLTPWNRLPDNRQVSGGVHARPMDDARIGRALRVLRQRRGLRQSEVAAAAGVPQPTISAIECGRLAGLPIATIRRVFAAVDAGFEGAVMWRGAGLDRLLDARHAALVGASVHRLAELGWETHVEASYSVYGERGSIDVLGGLMLVRAVLVEEVKSELANVEETIRKLDEKVRLVRKEIALDRFGWEPAFVGRLLVLPDSTTARQRVASLEPVLRVAFPDRGSAVRHWLREPSGALAGVLFQPDIAPGDRKSDQRGVHRVRGPRDPDSGPGYR